MRACALYWLRSPELSTWPPESLFLLMGIFPSTALLSRSSLTSCDPHFQYLLGAVFLSAAQSLHGETQTFLIRGGSAGVVCTSLMPSPVCLPVISMGTVLGNAAVPCTWTLVLLKPLLSEWSRGIQVTQVWWWHLDVTEGQKVIKVWRGR